MPRLDPRHSLRNGGRTREPALPSLRNSSCSSIVLLVTVETGPIRDPRILRAFAHPVRLRLYEALLAGGPATAAQLARDVPGAPGSLSYHLRTLAAHGFVEEAPQLAADGRERWWRAVPGGAHWAEDDLESSPGMRAASTAAQQVFLARQQERLGDWLRRDAQRFGHEWRSAAMSSDVVLHLSSTELKEMGQELEGVVDRWLAQSRSNRLSDTKPSGHTAAGQRRTERSRAAAEGTSNEGRRTHDRQPVFLVLHAFPFSMQAPEPPAGEPHISGADT